MISYRARVTYLITVGLICAVEVVSVVTTALCATSVLPVRDQRNASVWSAPRNPFTRATLFDCPDPVTVPVSNCSSTSVPLACAETDAIAAGGHLIEIWFHGSARVIFATNSSLNRYCPGLETNNRYWFPARSSRSSSGNFGGR